MSCFVSAAGYFFSHHETQCGLVTCSYVARRDIFFTIWRTCSNRMNAEDGTCGGIDCFEEKPRLDQT